MESSSIGTWLFKNTFILGIRIVFAFHDCLCCINVLLPSLRAVLPYVPQLMTIVAL
ncbi:unnamed protein product [Tenebrio molitor]|nr:unnamed protein product [Tenebrio molitor]